MFKLQLNTVLLAFSAPSAAETRLLCVHPQETAGSALGGTHSEGNAALPQRCLLSQSYIQIEIQIIK